jgi:hypothetical protein
VKLAKIVKQANTVADTQPVITPTHPTPQPTPTPPRPNLPLPTVLLRALPSLPSPTETALPMLVVNFPVLNDEEQDLHDVMPAIEREETEREETESENDSIEDTVPTFVSTMDSRQARNIEKQEARWIELGLDRAVPKPKLKSQSQRPTKKRSKTADAEKRTSKRVREKTTTDETPVQVHLPDPQPTLQHLRKKGKTMFDDEWEINGEEQPPDKGDLMNREQGYF